MDTRKDAKFISTPTRVAQEVLMVEDFAKLAGTKNLAKRAEYVEASLKTQKYVDAIFAAVDVN